MTERSLRKMLFEPESIAVVGASGNEAKLGAQVFERLAKQFRGELFAVNPGQSEILGHRAVKSVRALPQPVDLLIALTPAASLVEAIEEIQPGQVGIAVAVSSGFAEAPGDGPALQARLAAAARRAKVRVIGPNVVGVLSPVTGLNASIIPLMPPGGSPGLGVVTQSGGFGMALAMYASDTGMAVSRFCDVGNTVDVSAAEVVQALVEDQATGVIGIFIESVRDLPAFCDAVEAAARLKPVVMCQVGRTPPGATASLAHVGVRPQWSAGSAIPSAIHEPTGFDLLVSANAILWQGQRATGRRLAIVTGTGGVGSELADLAHEHGLGVPAFSQTLRDRIGRELPPYAGMGNPVDATPIWRQYPEVYPALISAITDSAEVDVIAVSITDVPTMVPDLAEALAALVRRRKVLPFAVYWASRDADLGNAAALRAAGIPVYRTTRHLIGACAALASSARTP
jgi:acyl-CoA synthetase (NDP forming)